jgi:hypothetical protein
MKTANRYVVLTMTNPKGVTVHRIIDTQRFEFEPRLYSYFPEQECNALNGIIDVQAIDVQTGPRSEERI